MPRFSILLPLVAAFVVFSASVKASTITDPALLRITSLNDAFPSDTTTDPVVIGADGFRLTYIGSDGGDVAKASLVDPVLLILGIPTGGVAPTLTVQDTSAGVTTVVVDKGGTANYYGGSWNTTTGFSSAFTSGDVETTIGLTPSGTGSQNYPNWTTADPGPTTSWDLYVYTLTFTPDFAKDNWVDFLGTLVAGTYVIAYGCDVVPTGNYCGVGGPEPGETYSTPFTYAGLVTGGSGTGGSGQGGSGQGGSGQAVVPEPASLLLLGTGLSLIASRVRSRAKRRSANS